MFSKRTLAKTMSDFVRLWPFCADSEYHVMHTDSVTATAVLSPA